MPIPWMVKPGAKKDVAIRNEETMDALTIELQDMVDKGDITPDEMDIILGTWEQELNRKGFSNWIGFPTFARKEMETLQSKISSRQAKMRDYLPKLEEFLSSAQTKGQIAPEEANQILQGEERLLRSGVVPANLPNYQPLQSFISWQKETAEEKRAEKRQGAEAVTRSFIAEQEIEQARLDAANWAVGQTGVRWGNEDTSLGRQQIVREQMRNAWEQWHQEALSSPVENGNWIERWQLEHAPNPYTFISDEEEREAFNLIAQERAASLPPTPDWLARLQPELRAGSPIRKVGITPPSAQQWSSLLPSQRSQWAGFVNWMGKQPRDILEGIGKTQPRTPFGAGRFGWRIPQQGA